MADPAAEHQCFSASQTAYLRSLDPDDRTAWAVHYERPPVNNGNGTTTHSLVFPMLIVTAYLSEGQAVAERVAKILNKHWDEEEQADG